MASMILTWRPIPFLGGASARWRTLVPDESTRAVERSWSRVREGVSTISAVGMDAAEGGCGAGLDSAGVAAFILAWETGPGAAFTFACEGGEAAGPEGCASLAFGADFGLSVGGGAAALILACDGGDGGAAGLASFFGADSGAGPSAMGIPYTP